jgi:UDPglucose 6-dehydrogenase
MIYFAGTSHAAQHLRVGAKKRGLSIALTPNLADLIFVSEDTPTAEDGTRDVEPIRELVHSMTRFNKQIVLTSQVPPGFTRSLGITNIFHQAETLRIIDAEHRAENPDYIAVGGQGAICPAYTHYLLSFRCPVIRMGWEEAEMSKIAVNMMLAAQVDFANKMAFACEKVGADWSVVAKALHCDKRLGEAAYLTPGRWEDSRHLWRDWVTLREIMGAISTS